MNDIYSLLARRHIMLKKRLLTAGRVLGTEVSSDQFVRYSLWWKIGKNLAAVQLGGPFEKQRCTDRRITQFCSSNLSQLVFDLFSMLCEITLDFCNL